MTAPAELVGQSAPNDALAFAAPDVAFAAT
jgi:hypothetical protein